MILLFIVSLFATLFVVRILSHRYHDRIGYKVGDYSNDKSKTITGWLRRKTGVDLHHIHFGLIILLVVVILIIIYGLLGSLVVFLAIGLSLVADQITPLIDKKSNYFSKSKLILSFILHIIIVGVFILVIRIS